jgi:hypothetical protein
MSIRSEARSGSSVAAAAVELETPEAQAFAVRAQRSREPVTSDGSDAQREPLSEVDLAALARAGSQLRAVGRAASLARFHAVGFFALAAATAPFALLEPQLLGVAAFACCSGASELYGARLVRALDVRGPRWLGVHQLVLLAAVALYCGYSIHAGLGAESMSDQLAQASPDLATMLEDDEGEQAQHLVTAIDGAYRVGVVVFYLTLLLVTALYQGAVAYYHFSRAAQLRAYLRETPRWAASAARRLLGW